MPDKRRHRGPHPEDRTIFAGLPLASLMSASADYRWLLDRGYAEKSTLKLVGDRHQLVQRQRTALARANCTRQQALARRSTEIAAPALQGQTVLLDGFNVLVTLEAALGGAVLLACRDGCIRDMASMHGTWRRMDDTLTAVLHVGEVLQGLAVAKCVWYLDRPVSNSGRLKQILVDTAVENGWQWEVNLVADPDAILATAKKIIVTADSGILDRCSQWFNLGKHLVESLEHRPWMLDFQEANA